MDLKAYPTYALFVKRLTRTSDHIPLICALIEQESSWTPWALRQERGWFKKLPNYASMKGVFLGEGLGDSVVETSYGLMQIMFLRAWELGFRGKPSDLFDPLTNIYWGTTNFYRDWDKYSGDVPAVISAYNWGSAQPRPEGEERDWPNQVYVDSVLGKAERWAEILALASWTEL